MNFPADIIGLFVTAVIGFVGALFVFTKGKDAAKKEEELKAVEEHNEAVRVVNEVRDEVEADLSDTSDDHLSAVAHRWLRTPSSSGTKPN